MAEFPEIMQSVSVGEELLQCTPPPEEAMLSVIEQWGSVAEALEQYTPPPNLATLSEIVQ